MQATEVQSGHLQPGARWQFTHRTGKVTEYEFDRYAQAGCGGLIPMIALTNPATGKQAFVGEDWLYKGRPNGTWTPLAVAPEPEAA